MLNGKKTYIVAALGIAAAVVTAVLDSSLLNPAQAGIASAILAALAALRHGMSNPPNGPTGAVSGLLFLSVLMVGCSIGGAKPNPMTEYGQALVAYNSVLDAAVAAKQAGRIDAETYRRHVLPMLERANEARRQWRAALDAGQPVNLPQIAFSEAMVYLREYVARAHSER